PGFDAIAEEVELERHLETADLVVTGEGFLDDESFNGKVVGGVAEMAASLGVRVLAVVGEGFDGAARHAPSGLQVVSLVDRLGADRARSETAAWVESCVRDALARIP